LEKQGIDDKDIIHALLMRSLFILFLEDKGAAAEAGLYEHIKKGARSYFDILEDPEATYQLFEEVQVHFNGNILPVLSNERKVVNQEHLKLIRKCFIDGDISSQPKMFDDWRLFDFKIIQIELLSEIYENFLGELKRVRGQFYTPHSLVELILKDKLPTNKTTFNVKVLDIACGSGIFLVESYRRLIKRWKRANHSEQISFKTLNKLLVNNIYGIEIDKTAIKVAALSLYLALVDELDPKTLWIKTDYQLPFLIFDPDDQTIPIENQGKNLWRRDTIGEVNADEFIKADLVVGNPPFGTKKIMKSIINYLNKKKYPMQMVLAFIDKATTFAPKGEIALIFNTKSLTNTNKKYQNFRKWLFNKNHVNKIYNLSIYRNVKRDFGGKLFEETTVPISIIYFQKENPSTVSDTIEYVAPKTYVKSNLVDGLVIDSSDVKFLPRSECQKPDTRIWKIAMWGNIHDFRLIERLNRKFPSIKQYMLEHDDCWSSGTGYISDSQHLEVVPPRLISTEKIRRYYTKPTASFANNRLYRKITKDLFTPPFIVVKEGQHNNEIAASYIDYETGSLKSTYVINGKVSSDLKKALVAYINSTFASYYLFLTTSSWGIERERILFEELLEMPSIISNISKKNLKDLSRLFDEIKEADESSKISDIRLRIDKVLYDVLGLNKKELVLISDCLKFQLDLFDKGIDSLGFHRTLQPENIAYAQMLSNELNTFLESSKTCVNAVIYDVGLHDPLNMTVLYFVKSKSGIMVKNIHKLRSSLLEIDKYMLQQKAGQSIYVQKQLRYFNSNAVYIIKPNQKRFWTCSQGIDDATSIIAEIISMEGAK
jgi:type I restriction-modification system DNA methylase subunit